MACLQLKDGGSALCLPPLEQWRARLSRRGTDVKTELIAGVTTFSMVAYIIVVNPVFLVQAGIPQEAAIISTVFAAAFSTIIVGLRANLPFVIIPGMGLL